ncbi:MAG: alpha-ketoglutarate-dependent dioxygenase AlkB [Pseudomonadota bacterium]
MSVGAVELKGVKVVSGLLDHQAQIEMLAAVRTVLTDAPLFRPVTPRGKPMSVRMSAAGAYGWVTDRQGYRYERRHPSGVPWPPIPSSVLEVWNEVAGAHRAPECCLINWYDANARMGLHQDRDEADFSMPVVSISLGDDALFRVGGTERRDGTRSIWLRSGDVAVMGGEARLAYHGIDRIQAGTSTLMPKGGRINLTLRVVT